MKYLVVFLAIIIAFYGGYTAKENSVTEKYTEAVDKGPWEINGKLYFNRAIFLGPDIEETGCYYDNDNKRKYFNKN